VLLPVGEGEVGTGKVLPETGREGYLTKSRFMSNNGKIIINRCLGIK